MPTNRIFIALSFSVTDAVLLLTLLVSLVGFSSSRVYEALKFIPRNVRDKHEYWRIFSHALVHQHIFHLLLNLFVLFIFGKEVERFYIEIGYSPFWFALLYIFAIPASIIFRLVFVNQSDEYQGVGASGAVSAIILSYIVIRPEQTLDFDLIWHISIPGIWIGVLYLLYSLYMIRKNRDTVGHDAHLSGAIWGMLFTLLLNPGLFTRLMHSMY